MDRIYGFTIPWWDWNGIPYVILAGWGLLVAWALLVNEAIYARARGENRKV